MLIVPATFLGHSVVCDKCGVTFLAMPPQQPQYMAPPPPQPLMPPLQPLSPPMPPPPPPTYGYGGHAYPQPREYPPPTYSPGRYRAPAEPSSLNLPSGPDDDLPPLPQNGGEQYSAPHPFGNPLPEIEILPSPKAKKQSSRKRSSGSKRSRRRSSGERASHPAPPPLPKAPAPSVEGRISHTALARADHGPSGEVSEIERRIRRAQLKRTISLAFAVVGLLAMSVVGILMIKYAKPRSTTPLPSPAAAPPAENGPTESAPATPPGEQPAV